MMRTAAAIRSLVCLLVLLALSHVSFGQIAVGISVGFAPPPIPIYDQPICPADGYLWTPGYWAYDEDAGDYYWVPGTWVEPPEVGFLWTPGWWGWGGSAFIFHEGYWGPHVGFYGGINYGFGYGGVGYEGGRWEGGHFSYNTYVNHVNTTIIHNTYNVRITNVTETHVSYNGGEGGLQARESEQDRAYESERHVGPVAAQTQHVSAARSNPELRASANHGKPPIAATARPGDFKSGAVASRQAGGQYKAPPRNVARTSGNANRPENENRPAGNEARSENGAAAGHSNAGHANQLEEHKATSPNTGNAATDKKYQHQQEQLAAKQNQEHQKLQQQQEKEHQQATQKKYNDAQKQQMEQRHQQQTQQLEQKHAAQTQHLQQRQAPRPAPASHAPAQKH
jgi:hypothetical protein